VKQKPETGQRASLYPFVTMLGRHWKAMALGSGLALMAAVAAIGLLALSGWFLAASALAGMQAATAQMFNFFYPSVGVRLLAIVRTGTRYGERIVSHDATFRILETLRTWSYRRIEPLAPARLSGLHSGDVLSRIITDIDTLDNLYLRVLSPTAVALLAALATVLFIGRFNRSIALVAAVALIIAGVGIPAMAQRLARTAARRLNDRTADLRTALVEGIDGLAALLSSGAERRYLSDLNARHHSLVHNQYQMSRITGLTAALLSLTAGLATAATLAIGVSAVASAALTGPRLAMLVLAVMALFDVVAMLPTAYQYLGQTRRAAARVLGMTAIQPAVSYPRSTQPAMDGGVDIDLRGVTFRYAGSRRPALENIDLHIPGGRHLAIMGDTGAGKSTLLYLLARFEDPCQGEIRLGRRPLTGFSEADLRRLICIIDQRAHIFSGTIRDNLVLARPRARDDDLWHALAVVQLDDFVRSLPHGLETWLGEAGRLLSGGQARRLAVARAVLSDTPVWVLDEPTEGLDRETADAMLKTLIDLGRDNTIIVVTHQREAARRMDEAIVLRDGRIAAAGPVAQF
jgi:ATP-binding cassette, subfamily C, bacterial CydC